MNHDAKLYAKEIAERLRMICKTVIGTEQLAFVEKRVIHEGHLIINKVLELSQRKKVKGLMTLRVLLILFAMSLFGSYWKK
jgi:hypothetical protein